MVMIGVFLALLVDEWREERQIEQIVELTEERILSEIHANYDRLLNYQQNLNDRFERLRNWGDRIEPGKSFREQSDFPGIPTVSLSDAAWARANSSDMTNYMDTDIIERAHGLYTANLIIMNGPNALLDVIYSPISWDQNQTVVSYNITEDIFREVVSQVAQSLEGYEEFVTQYPL